MPPEPPKPPGPQEQDDPRGQQIDALRRYIAELGNREQLAGAPRGQPAPPEARRQASVPWLLLTVLLVAVALVGGILIGEARANNQRAAAEGPKLGGATDTTRGGPVATPECKTAVDRANNSIALAVRVQSILRDYTRVMHEFENGRITRAEAIKAGTPSEVAISINSAKFDSSVNDYRAVVDKCRMRVP